MPGHLENRDPNDGFGSSSMGAAAKALRRAENRDPNKMPGNGNISGAI